MQVLGPCPGLGGPLGVSRCHIRPRNARRGSGTRECVWSEVCVPLDRTGDGVGRGEGRTETQRGRRCPVSLSKQSGCIGIEWGSA